MLIFQITSEYCKKVVDHVRRIEEGKLDSRMVIDSIVDNEKVEQWGLRFDAQEDSESDHEDLEVK